MPIVAKITRVSLHPTPQDWGQKDCQGHGVIRSTTEEGFLPKGQDGALRDIRAGVRRTDQALTVKRNQPKEEGPAIGSR